ncbi:MAG: peptidoglycan-binding domain-containing protein [Candidatus Omnitrophota bacterium]
MSSRARIAEKQDKEEAVSSEIEIITSPEANIRLLSSGEKKQNNMRGISPGELLPAVGHDATVTQQILDTKQIQQALKSAGFDPGLIDGKIGPKTKKAVKDFQKANNLVADGIVGKRTWEKLKPFFYSSAKE